MKKLTRIAVVATAAVAIGGGGVACSKSATENATAPTTSTTSEAPVPKSETIKDYIKANNITETAIKPTETGVPVIGLPFPPGWVDAGANTPTWSFGAILFSAPRDPNNPPNIIAVMSKLTGTVDPNKILDYAPNEMRNMGSFAPLGEPIRLKVSGFDAVQAAGTYVKDNATRAIVQTTVVIPTQGGVYAVQLNADAPEQDKQQLFDAMKVINEGTKITP